MLSSPRLRHVRRLSVMFVGLLLVIGNQSASPPAAVAAPSCGAFTTKVYDQVNPATAASGTLRDRGERGDLPGLEGLQRPNRLGDPDRERPRQAASIAGVHRLYRAQNENYFYSLNAAEIARGPRSLGYVDHGVAFYAGTSVPPAA